MPICFRFPARCSSALLTCALCLVLPSSAQTLAHPGWAGNGVTVESWWRRAVFYRIDPDRFQDSDADGHGDLTGIVKRMDYLRSLGIDALIIQTTETTDGAKPLSPEGFDEVVRAAVGAHLRVMVELGTPASQAPEADAQYLALAKAWLNQGAAGLFIPTQKLAKVDGANHIAVLLHQLRVLTNGFPGERILIGGQSADTDVTAALARETQLTEAPAITTEKPDVASLRAQLQTVFNLAAASAASPAATAKTHAANRISSTQNLLLFANRVPTQSSPEAQTALAATLAAALLTSSHAVLLDYGEELGLAATSNDPHPLMQWTPTNALPKPKPPPEPVTVITPPLPDDAPKYGSFKEFVPPLPRNLLPPPKMPEVFESDNPQPRILDPDAQPGFTDGTLDTALSAPNGATANVAMENLDLTSLLNFTRRLIRLHHDNAILHTGMENLTNRDAENILQWSRHSPTGNIVVLCNIGSNAAVLDATTLHAKSMRTLATSGTTKDGIVPAETVVVVETH